MYECRPAQCGTGGRNEKMTKGMKPIIPFIYIWGAWLKFPWRHSLSGWLKMHCRLGLEVNCIWTNGERQLIIHSRHPLWNILNEIGEFFSDSRTARAVCLPMKCPSVPFLCIGNSVRTCLTASDWVPGTTSHFWGTTVRGRRNLTEQGMEICLSIFFFEQSKVWELLFYPEWVSGILWRQNYAAAFACLGFLSIFWLPR